MALSKRRSILVGSMIGAPVTFVLEVLGAMGATWGSSEVFEWRNDNNQMAWRLAASAILVTALARYIAAYFVKKPDPDQFSHQAPQYILYAFAYPHKAFHSLPLRRKTVLFGLILGMAVTFVLEVCGAAGAIWGSSDIVGLRHNDNTEAWRAVALIFFANALVRFVAKYVAYRPQSQEERRKINYNLLALVFPHKALNKATFIENIFFPAFTIGLAVTLDLEVLGAAGAIWGSSDVFGLKNESSATFLRVVAITFCAMSLIRYCAKYRDSESLSDYQSDDCAKSHFWRAVESPAIATNHQTLGQRLEKVYPLLSTQ